MTEEEADVLKISSKTMEAVEAAEAPMPAETQEGALKIAVKVHKRFEMVLEELKLMGSEAGADNRIIQDVVDMVVATTKDELKNMTAEEADALKMLSIMAEAPMLTETRKGALKMVAEAPKKLEMAAGEFKLTESESGTTTTVKASTEGRGGGDLVIKYTVAEVTK